MNKERAWEILKEEFHIQESQLLKAIFTAAWKVSRENTIEQAGWWWVQFHASHCILQEDYNHWMSQIEKFKQELKEIEQ